MIIDTSAIVAILRDEAGASDCALATEKTLSRRISAANFVETALVIDGSRNPIASRRFDEFFKEANIGVEPVTLDFFGTATEPEKPQRGWLVRPRECG